MYIFDKRQISVINEYIIDRFNFIIIYIKTLLSKIALIIKKLLQNYIKNSIKL